METNQQIDDRKESRPHNRRLAKKRVQCLNEALYFVSNSVLADSLVFEIRFFAKRQNVGNKCKKTDTADRYDNDNK